MVFTNTRQPTKRRGRSKRVTDKEITECYKTLRNAAAEGSVQAAAALISLSMDASSREVANGPRS